MGFSKTSIVSTGTDVASDAFISIENLELVAATIGARTDEESFAVIWAQLFLVLRNGSQVINQALLAQGYIDEINSVDWQGLIPAGPLTEVMGRIYGGATVHVDFETMTKD